MHPALMNFATHLNEFEKVERKTVFVTIEKGNNSLQIHQA